jgi:SAM-dependent methyltransferase
MYGGFVFEFSGVCPVCEQQVAFASQYDWFRDHLRCSVCHSLPRERALMSVISKYFSDWRQLRVHESSPGNMSASLKLQSECEQYSSSQFIPGVKLGSLDAGTSYRCESLEELSFADSSFDLFVTQDVMEHIFDWRAAFKEIARVLAPGGAHVFTVPLVNKFARSEICAARSSDGTVVYYRDAEFHGNPIDPGGSLVTMRWGFDIASTIQDITGLPTVIFSIDDIHHGIRAEYIEVVVMSKPLIH